MAGAGERFLVVIVLHNSGRWITPCLRALARAKAQGASPEIRVVDNGSTDDGAEIMRRDFPDIRLIDAGGNLGFAAGNNLGARDDSSAEFILLLNPDTEIDADVFDELAAAFDADPALGVAGCRLVGPDGVTLQHVGGFVRPNGLTWHKGDGERDEGQYRARVDCDYVQGAAMAVRRPLWERLGGLDAGFFPAYYEETDFCFRARAAGAGVAAVCAARVVHHQDTTAQVRSPAFLRMYFRGRARFLMRNYSLRRWLTEFIPAEVRWLRSPDSKGLRRIAVRNTLRVLLRGGSTR